ncbi:MAG: patatin-like phospholipase family protein [Actinobacteria bacterium]|nr:MAG: patatin-like phospholipase family protein [Actinomycetota bacterium]
MNMWHRFDGADGQNEDVARRPGYRNVLRFRQRRQKPKDSGKVAVVLSGGGNRGVAQVGMLKALVEAGVRPDVVVGTSVGSLNGAALARDPTRAGIDDLEAVWLGLSRERLFGDGRLTRAWRLASRASHIWSNEGLAEVIDSFGVADFSELAVPLRVIATDLVSGEEAVFAAGPLKPALLASCGLPGLYAPIEHDGRMLVDGGVINNVPVSHALAGPDTRVYVCDTAADLEVKPPRSAIEVILRSFAIARQGRAHRDQQRYEADPRVTFLPRVVDRRRPFDFSGAAGLIDAGYTAARDFLAADDNVLSLTQFA